MRKMLWQDRSQSRIYAGKVIAIVLLTAYVTAFNYGGCGGGGGGSSGSSGTPPTPSEEYYFGATPLPREQYDLIPMISAPAGAIQGLPAAYDLSNNMPTPGNQGQQSSCVGWAVAYALKSYQEQDERNWGINTSAHLFSPAYIYNQINGGRDRGSYITEAINILTAEGCATFATMPYNQDDYLTQPSQAAIAEATNYKCVIWRKVNFLDRSEIKGFLYSGAPLVISIQAGTNLYNANIKNTNYIYRSLGDSSLGGHAVTLVGYSDDRSAFKFINSWGADWGDGGYAWIDYSFFPNVCREAYWVQDYVATQRMGSIAVSSTPSSAGVYLNDVYKGTTPITLVNVSVGNYSLKISKTNYITQDIAVTVVENQTPSINVTLVAEALPPPTLMSPSYDSSTTDNTPDFDWSDIPGSSAYGIMVDNNPDFSSPEISQTTTSSIYTQTTPLTEGTYYWRVRTQDGSGLWGTWSSTWLFTVNPAVPTPSQVTSPNPANSAPSVITTTQLSWASAARATSYDVYFGTSSLPPKVVTDTTNTSYNPGTLSYTEFYYWRIDSKNSAGTTTGTVWSFTTQAQSVTPPVQITSPNPVNSTTDASITQQLSWLVATGATSYDVYFGTTSPGQFKVNQAGTSYNPGTLNYSTTYYWRIDSKNSAGTTTGTVWSFTTGVEPVTPPDQVISPSPSNGATSVSITTAVSWASALRATSYDVYFGTTNPPDQKTNTTSTTYTLFNFSNFGSMRQY